MMTQNKIIFHLTNDKTAKSCGAEQLEIERLVSQFNNGHLMRIGKLYINPRELVAFIIEEDKEVE
jgi:hypothetical protein